MMRYQNAGNFRRALEERLGNIAQDTGMPHSRLRKIVAFDRFLARLVKYQPENWVLKGGFALQLRLGDRARTTKDIDLLSREHEVEVYPALQAAGALDIGDWFAFEVTRTTKTAPEGVGITRYKIRSILDGRIFEDFHVDVGVGDPVVGPLEFLATPALLAFADLEPTCVPCYPITQQIAEKLHAYTRPRKTGESSRVKDFIDIFLFAEIGEMRSEDLIMATQATFASAGTHPFPTGFPPPPKSWSQSFRRMANTVGLSDLSLDQAYSLIKTFVDPLFGEEIVEFQWNTEKWRWE